MAPPDAAAAAGPAPTLDQAPCGLLTFTDDGTIRQANRRLHDWLEMPDGALLGVHVDRLLAPASRVFQSTHLFPLLKLHGRAEEIHLLLRTASGADLPVLLSATRDSTGEVALNHCALMTMLRRKEFEVALVDARKVAEAASVAKDEFLALVSHELRTPLSAISGWVRLARADPRDPALVQRALETIERNAQVQTQLIDDLLDVSRIVSGKMRISPRPIMLAPVVEAAIDTARPAALAKAIDLTSSIDPAAGQVNADAARVQQIVWNLLSNALKFTPKGGRVRVVLERVDSRIRIEVADSGAGIDPSHLPFLFDRFWQADASVQRGHTGLGLGLALCKSLVELHGGSLRADSAGPGAGSTFSVELPLAPAAPGRHGVSADPEAASAAQRDDLLAGVSVVVVDDDADTRSFMRALLEGAGAQVLTAAGADEALAKIRTAPPQVVISDINMVGKDGFAFMRELRADASIAHQPLVAIALTGLAQPHERAEVLRAGYQAHLAKPVDPAELLALVRASASRD